MDDLSLPDMMVVRVDETPALEIKMAVELAEPDRKWLFCSNKPEPTHEHDCLLDVRMCVE